MRTLQSLATAVALTTVANANTLFETTGLDQIVDIINSDTRIERKVSPEAKAEAIDSAEAMNELIREAIRELGLANDGKITISDAIAVNGYLVENYPEKWYELRGVQNGDESTGFYGVHKKSDTVILNQSAVNSVWGGIYNLGFEKLNDKKLSNYLGEKGGNFTTVGYNLSEVIAPEIESLKTETLYKAPSTGTGLDQLITSILEDEGLNRRVSTLDIREGARVSNEMNKLIIEAIRELGLANDGTISTADVRDINSYLVANHRAKWSELHGDDETEEETGYHLVQNDGAYRRIFADNVINTIADGIYHLGFPTDNRNRLLNEDGNRNQRFEKVAWWLDTLMREDLENGSLQNSAVVEVVGSTGTGLDDIIGAIYGDIGLLQKVSTSDIREGARASNEMNRLVVEAIRETGAGDDSFITPDEVGQINSYLVTNYVNEWTELHGDDEEGEETGFHRVQNDGAKGTIYNRNIINRFADSIYHLGFPTQYTKNLENEDGNKNASFRTVAYWLNRAIYGR
jgi:hypothetical protein